jgi:omega-hydroxy-beta-dihydromenaquinone-9 sulfotransferase
MEGLIGITLTNLFRLTKENHFNIDKPFRKNYAILILMAARNSLFQLKEKRLFEDKIKAAEIPEMIFVLGHWRSGTTLLHNLLSIHPGYACPNQFQVSKPFVFLTREEAVAKMFAQAQARKRAMDNVEVRYDSPGEDESALAVGSLRSPYLGWTFPKNDLFYERFLSMQDANQEELTEWKNFFIYFIKKLSVRFNGKPLIFKSPTHTARIPILLEMFPTAKFVHIHRNPYSVFQSTHKFYHETVPNYYIQNAITDVDHEESIIRKYKIMYDSFFHEYRKIPSGQFHEISFEELEADQFNSIMKITEVLNLERTKVFEGQLQEYISRNQGYQRNRYQKMDSDLQMNLYEQFQESFERWGYSKDFK